MGVDIKKHYYIQHDKVAIEVTKGQYIDYCAKYPKNKIRIHRNTIWLSVPIFEIYDQMV
ncbi:MAG: hypothetical protein J6S67_00040 [Methanobrevibacter sp.]|nr:hypothetical protein [Methanobrevibacter sp.]